VRGLREVAEVGAELILLNPAVFDEAEQMALVPRSMTR
jgi:hypothetical protein